MVIPLATVEGFNPSPPPADWTDEKPVFGTSNEPAKPVISRFERPYGSNASTTAPTGAEGQPVALPPRTIGSKIPINRRHKRRR
jgi:hypothetical protein